MTEQREFFPDRKPRRDWLMTEALGVYEHFLKEAAERGLEGKDAADWASARTWEKVEGTQQPQGENHDF